jgi:hypothetical protein
MTTLSPDRVEWHLWNWTEWMRHSRSPGALPKRASGGCSGYRSYDIEYEYAEADRVAAVAVQAIIDGMPPRQRTAVYVEHGVMSAVYRVRDHDAAYTDACNILGAQLASRGMC